jgi:hypothetical protein
MMTATNGYRQITQGRRGLGEGSLPGTQPSAPLDPQSVVLWGQDSATLPGITPRLVDSHPSGANYVPPSPDKEKSWFEKQTLVAGVSNTVIVGGAGLLLLLGLMGGRR